MPRPKKKRRVAATVTAEPPAKHTIVLGKKNILRWQSTKLRAGLTEGKFVSWLLDLAEVDLNWNSREGTGDTQQPEM